MKPRNPNNAALLLLALLLPLAACSPTKYVEENEYLLNKVDIKVEGKKVPPSELTPYLYQTPNPDWLFIPKASLKIYSLSGSDTTKWINRKLRKWGSAPVIHQEDLTEKTEKQFVRQLSNMGYLNAEVTHRTDTTRRKKKRVNLTYIVQPNEIYTVRRFSTEMESNEMTALLKYREAKAALNVKTGEPFDAARFDEVSTNLTNAFYDMGYYMLSKENFYFLADTAVGNHQVDVTLKYRTLPQKDSTTDLSLTRYKFRNVTIYNGVNPNRTRKKPLKLDTTRYKDFTIINGDEQFLRPSVLYNNIFIRPGRYYSDDIVDNTYASFGALGAVSQVGVEISPQDSAQLDASITLSKSKLYHFQFGVDGTNSAGDLGMATYASFQQKNLFHGSEIFNIKLNGAFEHINGNTEYEVKSDIYYEYGGEVSLTIPRLMLDFLPERYRKRVGASTVFSFGANWRKRPEYNRRFLSLDWKYNWTTHRKRMTHTLNLYNINYVVSPWTSAWFTNYLERSGNELLKESYKDQFITRSSYSFVYATNETDERSRGWTVRCNLDVAGTLPYLICSAIPSIKSEDGVYNIIGTPFAQYMKATFDVSKIFYIKEKTQMVAHLGLGFAMPYGNSNIIPYEQRFFAGGANTVRGWSTRTLGPGALKASGNRNFITQTGDVKIIFNVEYRQKTNSFLDVAVFFDAGNVWTVRDYEQQPDGQFSPTTFYKELGMAWGVGIRPNLKFIVLRLDAGMQIHDPALSGSSRWVITHPSWDICALHFAIGYPF